MSEEQAATIVISSTEERQRLLDKIRQISTSMERTEAEKDFINTATKNIVEEFQLPAKLVKKMITTYHKQNFKEHVATEEQFKSLYVQVTGGSL